MQQRLILGPPGTGKTTTLLDIVDTAMAKGCRPDRIAFCSFTKKAADEAITRAMTKFQKKRDQFKYFRTLHSLCYHQIGATRNDVLSFADMRQIGAMLGVAFSFGGSTEDGMVTDGDKIKALVELARSRCLSLEDVWHTDGPQYGWYTLQLMEHTLAQYKADTGKIDFGDMLEQYIAHGLPLDVDVAIVDEAQDLSTVQWRVVEKAFSKAKYLYIAGDDDQAIYRWAGADTKKFLSLNCDRKVLPQSYRLPKAVHALCNNIISGVKNRYAKTWSPTNEKGSVTMIASLDELDLGTGQWMLLARNAEFLPLYTTYLEERGLRYTSKKGESFDVAHVKAIAAWEKRRKGIVLSQAEEKDIELFTRQSINHSLAWYDGLVGIDKRTVNYYRNCLANGETIKEPARVYVGTVHSVKGGECENVVLLPDLSGLTYETYMRYPEQELKVWYVGASRSKNSIFILTPQTHRHFDFSYFL